MPWELFFYMVRFSPAYAISIFPITLLIASLILFSHSDGGSRFHNSFTRGHLPRGRGEEKNHIPRVPFRDLYHDLERYNRCPRGRIEGRGHIRKVSAKDLDEDLERYRLEAMKINKEN